jgi:hypothetical protein
MSAEGLHALGTPHVTGRARAERQLRRIAGDMRRGGCRFARAMPRDGSPAT